MTDWAWRGATAPGSAGVASPPASRPDLTRLPTLLWRQLGWALGGFFIAFLSMLIAIHSLAPVYRAAALVIVDPPSASLLDPLAAPPVADPVRVDGEVEILRSSAILGDVVRSLSMALDPEFQPRAGLPRRIGNWLLGTPGAAPAASEAQARKRLGAILQVSRKGATALIEVTASAGEPGKAAMLANAVVEAYLAAQIAAKRERLAAIGRQLNSQLARARALLTAADQRIDRFLDENLPAIADPDLRAELAGLRSGLSDAVARRIQFEGLATRSRERADHADWSALSGELTSDRLAELRRQRQALQANAAVAPLGEAARRLAGVDAALAGEADALIRRIVGAAEAAARDETELRDRLARRLGAPDIPAGLLLRFRESESDAGALRQVVEKLAASAREAEAGGETPLADVRVVAPALPPVDPVFPDVALFDLLAAGLAAIAGIAVAIWRDQGREAKANALKR